MSRCLGTNPFAIAIPVPKGGGYPVILDMATSVAGRSKILVAIKKGGKIPVGGLLIKMDIIQLTLKQLWTVLSSPLEVTRGMVYHLW